ncbi:MAG TPA: D-arabinono-1,4-lactone oxidase [Pseudomonadota bacterium]|nr:D-arabinono-1,4-lactone oxidase [Pseudomonadota bacterium]
MQAGRQYKNWLGNVAFTPCGHHEPADEAAVIALVRRARQEGRPLRVVGGGHSWSAGIETDGYLLSLDRMTRLLHVDPLRHQVTVQAGIRLRELSAQLHQRGLALVNLGSIQEQSLAGAISTGTHGTGLQFGVLATQVLGLRLVTGTGEVVEYTADRDPELLDAARVSLGALGVITQVTLQAAPAFNLREERTPLPFAEALALVPGRLGEADHIKLWWLPHAGRVQIYRQYRTKDALRARRGLLSEDTRSAQEVFRALLALGSAFPRLIPPIQRLLSRTQFTASSHVGPSFRVFSLAMPPRHHESEYAVPLPCAAAAVQALHDLILARRHRVHFILELRFVKGDSAWLSPAYGGEVCFIGAYDANRRGWPGFRRDFEELMRGFAGRPHWGKEFTASADGLRAAYPRWDDFQRLRQELDPAGVFLNRHLQQVFGLGG